MAVIKMLAFLLLGVGAFLVYGARFVAAKLDKRNTDFGTDTHEAEFSEQDMATNDLADPLTEDEEKIMQKIPSKAILKVKTAGLVLILAGGILVLVAFR